MARNEADGYVLLIGPDGYYPAVNSRKTNRSGLRPIYLDYLEAHTKALELNKLGHFPLGLEA